MTRYISTKTRTAIAIRADDCCEYCKLHVEQSFFSFEIDHIISIKHGGLTILENLAYSCFPCNNYKGSDIGSVLLPDRTFVRFFDPRNDIWDEHFEMDNGLILSKTNIGEVTVKMLKINEVNRIIERRIMTQ